MTSTAGYTEAPGCDDARDFSNKVVRQGFVRKVYGILGAQLALTTVVGGAVMSYTENVSKTALQPLMLVSLVVTVAMICVFSCSMDTMRSVPLNYILLFLFTAFEGVLVGAICTQYTTTSVLFVLGLTMFIVLSLSLFACQTKYDFTGLGPYLFCALMGLMGIVLLMSLTSIFMPGNFKTINLIISGLGALLFSFYIVYDTQLIVGGDHKKYQFEVDDYCMAAISLYLDIINLFLYLLELFGDRN